MEEEGVTATTTTAAMDLYELIKNFTSEDMSEFPDSDFGLLNYGKFFLFLEEGTRPPPLSSDHQNILVDYSRNFPSQYSTTEIILLSVIMTAMMVVVIIGNMLVIIAIATEHSLSSVQNWFIASLAFADLSLGLVIMPFSLAHELLGYWAFGSLWCDIHSALDVLLSTASIMNLCLISLDRYWSITRALDYLNSRTQPRVLVMIVTVWLLSAFICIPPLLGWRQEIDIDWFYQLKQEQQERNLTALTFGEHLSRNLSLEDFANFTKTLEDVVFPKCQLSEDIGYVLYSAFGSFYIPSCIMVFVYIKIYFAARARARRHIKVKTPDPKEYAMVNSQTDEDKKATYYQKLMGKNKSFPGDKFSSPTTHINGKPKKVLLGEEGQEGASNGGLNDHHHHHHNNHQQQQHSSCHGDEPNYSNQSSSNREEEEGACQQHSRPTSQSPRQKNGGGGGGSRTLRCSSLHRETLPGGMKETSSYDSGLSRCAPLRAGILNKLSFDRRLSKEAREVLDTGRLKTIPSQETDGDATAVSAIAITLPVVAAAAERHTKTASAVDRERRRIARQKERRATLILGLIMGSFIACWLPFFILYSMGPICPVCHPEIEPSACCVESWVFSFAFWLGYSNSALNPVIYTVFNKDFRKAFKKILFK